MKLLAGIFVVSFAFTPPLVAGETDHTHDPAEKLGTVRFTTSCTPEAQPLFDRGVAQLHSFGYAPAAAHDG